MYDNIGDGHTFLRIQFAFEMELTSLFYQMYYNIRRGLGLQSVIVVFPDQTHLVFWSLVEKVCLCITADTDCLFKYMLVKVIVPTFSYTFIIELIVYWEPYDHLFC